MSVEEHLYNYLLMLGDNSMILAHRLSELCGHGPTLETDIALTNISLDLFGQVRNYFQYAAKIKGGDATEDKIAFLRYAIEHRNVLLVEQPNTDLAHVFVRQFLFDTYHQLLLEQLSNSNDATITAIAIKSLKEVSYHLRFSTSWMNRLGDGTQESHNKMQAALDHLYPFVFELFETTDTEKEMHSLGIAVDPVNLKSQYMENVNRVIEEATLSVPDAKPRQAEGKWGRHSEHLGYILSDFQYMQRAYPEMQW